MKREIKDSIYKHFSTLTKALASPKRIEIIDLLCQGEKTVEALAEQGDLGIKNASAQLKELKSARLVKSRQDGKYVFYRLADESVAEFWRILRDFGNNRIAEIQQITKEALSTPDILEHMTRKQLLAKAKLGEIVLIDVRPFDEFASGHLPFSVSVPVKDITSHLKTFSKKKEIVAYCRGPYCFFAKEAVEVLIKNGFKAYQLKDSVHDWKVQGLPIKSA